MQRTKADQVDFMGHLFGYPMAFDCKSMSEDRLIRSSGDREIVKESQLRLLLEFGRHAFAFLLVEFRKHEGETWAITPEWFLREVAGKKSVPRSVFSDATKRSGRT